STASIAKGLLALNHHRLLRRCLSLRKAFSGLCVTSSFFSVNSVPLSSVLSVLNSFLNTAGRRSPSAAFECPDSFLFVRNGSAAGAACRRRVPANRKCPPARPHPFPTKIRCLRLFP